MTKFSEWTWPSYTGGKDRTAKARIDQFGAVNAAEMPNFAGNGTTDDIVPLRAAVAKALTDGKGSVIIPAGASCAISDTLFLGYQAAQTNPAFSLGLVSPGRHANHEGQGGIIKPTFTGTGVLVGPGQEMLVDGVGVVDTSPPAYRGLANAARIGIGVRGGSGGASGWSLINCHVYGFHTGVSVGEIEGSLGDSGLIQKLNIDACGVGVQYISTQNYIQSLIGCTITAGTSIKAALGHNVNIFGGNISTSSGKAQAYTLSSVSALTKTNSVYSFTATVTNPDADLIAGLYIDGAMNLPHFGIVPVTVTGYNSGTQVISLELQQVWSLVNFQTVNIKTDTDFDAVNQANTYLGLAERVTTLEGTGFSVKQIHIENTSAYCRLLEAGAGFNGGTAITHIDGLYCDYDPGLPVDSDATKQIAKQLVAKSHPFVNLVNGSAILKNVGFSQNGYASITFDMVDANQLEVINWKALRSPNVRYTNQQNPFTGGGFVSADASGTGAGTWSPTPFYPIATSDSSITQRVSGWNRSEFWGWFPAKDRTPRLTPSQVTTLTGTLPTFTTAANTGYPLLCGGSVYSIGIETDTNVGAALFLRSNHKGYSYGQNLTTTNVTNLAWSFYGATTKLVLNLEAFGRIFPGLVLSLSHASISGGTPFEVIVCRTFYYDLYVEVMALSGTFLPGTAGTQYTGTTIGQAAYSITTV